MAEPVSQNQYISVFGRTTGMNGDNFDPIEFEGNGIAVLTPSKCTITETLNGGYSLTLTHPTDSDNVWKTLYPLNFIKSQGQLFRIQSIETSYDGSASGIVSAYAEHVTYMMNDAWITHVCDVYGSWMGGLLDKAKEHSRPNGYSDFGTNEKRFPNFTYSTDVEFPASYKTDGYYHHDIGDGKTRYQVMMEAIQKFGGELYRNNFYFSIKNRMENSLGGDGKLDAFDIRLGENMLGIKRKTDISNFCSYFSGYTDNGLAKWLSYADMSGLMNNIVREKHYPDITDFGILEHETASYFAYHMQPEFTYTLKLKDLRRNPDFKMLSGVRFKVGDIGRIVDERLGLSNNLRLEITQTKTNGITGEIEEITLKSISEFNWNYGSVKLPEFPDIPEPPEPPQPQIEYDETKINVVKYDENMQLMPESIEYYDELWEAGDAVNHNWDETIESPRNCHIHIGNRSSCVPTITDDLYYTSYLVSIDIPEGVTSFPEVFLGVTDVRSVLIPSTVTAIGDGFCEKCEYLQSITVAVGNTSYSSENGALFNANKTVLIRYASGNDRTSYTVPNGVTEIAHSAFYGAQYLESLTLPTGLTTIGYEAFVNCWLTTLTIPEGVQRLPEYLCNHIDVINIPSTCTYIDSSAFAYCGDPITININRPKDSIKGSPWGARSAIVNWTG